MSLHSCRSAECPCISCTCANLLLRANSLFPGESSRRFREQGIHPNFLILRRDRPRPHPKTLKSGLIFANSLLNSLPAGNGAPAKAPGMSAAPFHRGENSRSKNHQPPVLPSAGDRAERGAAAAARDRGGGRRRGAARPAGTPFEAPPCSRKPGDHAGDSAGALPRWAAFMNALQTSTGRLPPVILRVGVLSSLPSQTPVTSWLV